MSQPISIAREVARDDSLLATEFDASQETLWVFLVPEPGRPLTFSPALLAAFERVLDRLDEGRWHWQGAQGEAPVRYLVLGSTHPRYFALGGDLAHFQACIESANAGALRAYSMRCLALIERLAAATQYATTIAMVQGRALGGGFEAALSATHFLAERGTQFGFPEITFGTFPCTGGLSLLTNRIGLRRAAAFVRNPSIHSAEELRDQGVIDELCEPGEARVAVQRFIAEHRRRYKARMALQRAEARMGALDGAELRRVVDDWVATAMSLGKEERRVLSTLVRMQAADAGGSLTPPNDLKRLA